MSSISALNTVAPSHLKYRLLRRAMKGYVSELCRRENQASACLHSACRPVRDRGSANKQDRATRVAVALNTPGAAEPATTTE